MERDNRFTDFIKSITTLPKKQEERLNICLLDKM